MKLPPARPGYLLMTTLVAVVAVAVTGLIGETTFSKEALAELERQQSLEQRMQLAERRGWRIDEGPAARRFHERTDVVPLVATTAFRVSLSEGRLSGEAAPSSELSLWPSLEEELSRYPRGMLSRAGLRFVLLCSGLSQEDNPIASLPNFESTLLLDVDSSPAFLRRLIHHEVFHFLDFADDLKLREDESWAGLNDRFFSYGVGGRYARAPSGAVLGSGGPGFFSEYARSALEEDKAEVFSFVMSDAAAARELTRDDDVLRAKVLAIGFQVQQFVEATDTGDELEVAALLRVFDEFR